MARHICPVCQGPATGGRRLLTWLIVILLFPIGLLILLRKPTYQCEACGHLFQAW